MSTETVAITLNDQQLQLQARARSFAEREIRPISAERDRIDDPLECFPWDVWRSGSRQGLRTPALPRELGGEDMDVLSHCVALEELCVADCGFGCAFHQVWKTQKLFLMTDYLRETYIPKFVADDDYMISLGFTEPDSGSDNLMPYEGADGGSRTSGVRQPNGDWLINGKKHFIFAGGLSKGIFVMARTDRARGMSQGATVFFLERDTPGFQYGHIHSKMGWRLTPNAELLFDNVRVPDQARVGEVNGALAVLGAFGKPHAPTTSVFGIATGRSAFEQTLAMCRDRVVNGRPMAEEQAVAMRIADMWIDIEMARTITWKAAWSGEYNPDHDLKLGMISQLTAAEMVVRVCNNAMILWGGRGFMRDHPIEKLFRDAFANYHIDGVNDLNRLRITRALLGRGGGGYIG
ncbi:MAG: acyl-CoA/acyl-ACP dehydrogenase [Chloroflexi bacterium]|nr:acyl-CoA/acyl-ACP dehydrogenase [Chloroflexota bacterium]